MQIHANVMIFLKNIVNANAITFCECMPVQIMINLL